MGTKTSKTKKRENGNKSPTFCPLLGDAKIFLHHKKPRLSFHQEAFAISKRHSTIVLQGRPANYNPYNPLTLPTEFLLFDVHFFLTKFGHQNMRQSATSLTF